MFKADSYPAKGAVCSWIVLCRAAKNTIYFVEYTKEVKRRRVIETI